MSAPDAFEALHLARIRGLVPAQALGDVGDLVDASLLVITDGGCMLTAEGYEHHEQLLVGWRETIDLEAMAKVYERFLVVNQPMKAACSAWQSSAGDDEALFVAVDALTAITQRVRPALDRAGGLVARFGRYGPRLEAAVAAAGGGDPRFVTDPKVDSVHSIWFECHEDFLTTLGRSREDEGSF